MGTGHSGKISHNPQCFPQHQGKSAIRNGLFAAASGSILVLTDADCLLPSRALRCIIGNFSGPLVGLVTARPRYVNGSETSITGDETLYLRYESWLREQESERGVIAFAGLPGVAFFLPFFCSSGTHAAFSLRVTAEVAAALIAMVVMPIRTHPMRKRLLHWMLFGAAA